MNKLLVTFAVLLSLSSCGGGGGSSKPFFEGHYIGRVSLTGYDCNLVNPPKSTLAINAEVYQDGDTIAVNDLNQRHSYSGFVTSESSFFVSSSRDDTYTCGGKPSNILESVEVYHLGGNEFGMDFTIEFVGNDRCGGGCSINYSGAIRKN